MLAYVFWHRPRRRIRDAEAYEQAQLAFHRSLAALRPAASRLGLLSRAGAALARTGAAGGYEDWYLRRGLRRARRAQRGGGRRAAIAPPRRGRAPLRRGRGRRSTACSRASPTRPRLDGERVDRGLGGAHAAASSAARLRRAARGRHGPAARGLWRRQLVLGPAPEYCLLAARGVRGRRRDAPAARAGARDLDEHTSRLDDRVRYTRRLVATGVRVELNHREATCSAVTAARLGTSQIIDTSSRPHNARGPAHDDEPDHRHDTTDHPRRAEARRRALRLRALEGAPRGARAARRRGRRA